MTFTIFDQVYWPDYSASHFLHDYSGQKKFKLDDRNWKIGVQVVHFMLKNFTLTFLYFFSNFLKLINFH